MGTSGSVWETFFESLNTSSGLCFGSTNNLSSVGFGTQGTKDHAQLLSWNSVQFSPVIRAIYMPGAEDINMHIHIKRNSASLFINVIKKLLCGLSRPVVHPLSFSNNKNGASGG